MSNDHSDHEHVKLVSIVASQLIGANLNNLFLNTYFTLGRTWPGGSYMIVEANGQRLIQVYFTNELIYTLTPQHLDYYKMVQGVALQVDARFREVLRSILS